MVIQECRAGRAPRSMDPGGVGHQGSFVSRIGQDKQSDGLVGAIVGIAHTLGIRTIAEGVETSRQRDRLVNGGCDYLQGFLYSPPVPLEAFAALLKARVPGEAIV